jgi:hypothetical protein
MLLFALFLALSGAVPVFSDDFEAPTHAATNDLDGVNGWSVASATDLQVEVVPASLSYSGGVEVFADGGSQAVRFETLADNGLPFNAFDAAMKRYVYENLAFFLTDLINLIFCLKSIPDFFDCCFLPFFFAP